MKRFVVDIRSLAAARILLGATLALDLLQNLFDARELFSREGVLPRTLWANLYEFTGVWSLHLFNDSLFFARFILLVQIAFALMLLAGYRTRLATMVSWILFVSLLNRNLIATDGGDQIASYLLFCGLFLPWGDGYSIDAKKKPPPPSTEYSGLGSVFLLAQMAVMYEFAGLAKLMTPSWWNGEALDITLRWTEYTRPLAETLRGFSFLTKLGTWVTPWFECLAPLFFFFSDRRGRLRALAVVSFLLMHLSIDLTLRLSFFSCCSTAGLIAIFPAWIFDGAKARPKSFSRSTPVGAKYVAIFLALASVYSAVPSLLGEDKIPYPGWLATVNDVTFGYQNWNLFRHPPTTSGWYRAKATLQNGRMVDLFQQGSEFSDEKPRVTSDVFPSRRWLSFIMHAHQQWEDEGLRQNIARSFAEKWNAHSAPGNRVTNLSIIYYRENHPAFAPSQPGEAYVYASYEAVNSAD